MKTRWFLLPWIILLFVILGAFLYWSTLPISVIDAVLLHDSQPHLIVSTGESFEYALHWCNRSIESDISIVSVWAGEPVSQISAEVGSEECAEAVIESTLPNRLGTHMLSVLMLYEEPAGKNGVFSHDIGFVEVVLSAEMRETPR